ncbi:MAG: DUF1330 domain-containing protein [Parvularcula sp.]|jgi:uncharacterized protein (DUF1330 family)|nr:DUF1330 domain-containing protein [Parvularcula sp.]
MPAYMIVFAKIHDRERFIEAYGKPTQELIAKHGGEYILRAPGVESLEGGMFEGTSTVISRWPDKAAIKRFWDSDDYAKLKAARQELADAYVMVAEAP